MNNRYDILFELPAYRADDIAKEQDLLAQEIVRSGLLRITEDHAKNFTTYSGPSFDKTFSYRELTDPNLLPDTRQVIANTLPGAAGEDGVNDALQRLIASCKTARNISVDREMEIARLLVQATHPVVISLCLIERVHLFVSYSHSVADLMPIHFWETVGTSSGLQAVSGDGTAVYVSCGGNPFIEEESHKTYQSDGFPALARMQVIAGQELGHFADILRHSSGHMISRHSSHLQPLRAKESCAQGRLQDMHFVRHWKSVVARIGIIELAELERELQFYDKHRRSSAKRLWLKHQVSQRRRDIIEFAEHEEHFFISRFPKQLHGSKGWANDMIDCLKDMTFNLSPQADVYRRDNPAEEEAIACIEALARVPQQVNKWGPIMTQQCWPNLYQLYYEEVIPANIDAYERLTGKKWYFPELSSPKSSTRKLIDFIK